MSSSSITSAILKLNFLLTREEKLKWGSIIGFAFCTSLFEVITASTIVVFAQVLNQPEIGKKYLSIIRICDDLPSEHVILYVAVLVGLVYLVKNLVAAVEVFYQNFSIQKMNYHFKKKLLKRYAEADYGFYLTRNSSLSMQIVSGDAELIFSAGMTSIASIISEGIIFLCLIGMVIFMNPSLALILFVTGVTLGFGITKGVLPHFYRFGQKLQEAAGEAHRNLAQFFHGFKEVVLLGKSEAFINAYQYCSWNKSRVQAMQAAINALPRIVIEVLFVGLFIITIVVLCLEHQSAMRMIGTLGGYLYVGFRLMPGLNRIINQLNTFKFTIPSVDRVYQECNSAITVGNYLSVPDLQFRYHINLEAISFRHLSSKTDILSNIFLEIKKGDCIGIVGETGAGKSTLVDIILGLLKPYKGTILLDNKYPVNSYQWHQKIGYVSQSVYLIDDTIEANIAFGEKIVDELRLNTAVNIAQLKKLIDCLPYGLKTIVGERGVRLSGGERQRVAIARALYHNPEVLIFDEATSALDNETEACLMEAINAARQNRTVIMVAHRLTTLKNCDRIITMEKGTIKQITCYDTSQRDRETHL